MNYVGSMRRRDYPKGRLESSMGVVIHLWAIECGNLELKREPTRRLWCVPSHMLSNVGLLQEMSLSEATFAASVKVTLMSH